MKKMKLTNDKSSLTPKEALKVVYWTQVRGLNNNIVQEMMEISNPGRIAEANMALKWAAQNLDKVYEMAVAEKQANAKKGKNIIVFTKPKLAANNG